MRFKLFSILAMVLLFAAACGGATTETPAESVPTTAPVVEAAPTDEPVEEVAPTDEPMDEPMTGDMPMADPLAATGDIVTAGSSTVFPLSERMAERYQDEGFGGQITVDMGQPEFDPARIPLRAPAQAAEYSLEINGQSIRFGAVSMGNPHAVIAVDNIDNAPVTTLGPQIETHADFPKRVNVGFAQFTSPSEIQLRVWERGVGETQACGSGACAAVAVGRRQGRLDERVRIHLPGGTLSVSWAGPGEPVWMTGPASYVFDGEVEI